MPKTHRLPDAERFKWMVQSIRQLISERMPNYITMPPCDSDRVLTLASQFLPALQNPELRTQIAAASSRDGYRRQTRKLLDGDEVRRQSVWPSECHSLMNYLTYRTGYVNRAGANAAHCWLPVLTGKMLPPGPPWDKRTHPRSVMFDVPLAMMDRDMATKVTPLQGDQLYSFLSGPDDPPLFRMMAPLYCPLAFGHTRLTLLLRSRVYAVSEDGHLIVQAPDGTATAAGCVPITVTTRDIYPPGRGAPDHKPPHLTEGQKAFLGRIGSDDEVRTAVLAYCRGVIDERESVVSTDYTRNVRVRRKWQRFYKAGVQGDTFGPASRGVHVVLQAVAYRLSLLNWLSRYVVRHNVSLEMLERLVWASRYTLERLMTQAPRDPLVLLSNRRRYGQMFWNIAVWRAWVQGLRDLNGGSYLHQFVLPPTVFYDPHGQAGTMDDHPDLQGDDLERMMRERHRVFDGVGARVLTVSHESSVNVAPAATCWVLEQDRSDEEPTP